MAERHLSEVDNKENFKIPKWAKYGVITAIAAGLFFGPHAVQWGLIGGGLAGWYSDRRR